MAFSSLLLFDAKLSVFRGSSDLMSVLSALGTWSGSGVVIGAGPPPPEKVVSFPEEALGFMLGSCDIPLVTAGLNTDLFCRLIQGQFALIPHLPRAACTMSPIL